jgi:hypothetical protein
MLLFKNDKWWIVGIIAAVISQALIVTSWQDAKFGTIANVIILIAAIIGYGTWSFSKKYKNDVKIGLQQTAALPVSLLTQSDIAGLPELVQAYIRHSGSIGKPKVVNFKITFTGQLRKNNQSAWMPFASEQYNFIESAQRLFFMKATMKHLPVAGYHCFKNGEAFMDIRLFSLFKVQYQTGKEMGIAETVTFFNDMCCMAPATLIDKRITWGTIEGNKVKATFTNNGIAISAWLHFNEQGALINFISNDRYAASDDNSMKQIPWSTPLKDHKTINGHKLGGYTDAIYHYPEGDLIYGTFKIVNIEYNLKAFLHFKIF